MTVIKAIGYSVRINIRCLIGWAMILPPLFSSQQALATIEVFSTTEVNVAHDIYKGAYLHAAQQTWGRPVTVDELSQKRPFEGFGHPIDPPILKNRPPEYALFDEAKLLKQQADAFEGYYDDTPYAPQSTGPNGPTLENRSQSTSSDPRLGRERRDVVVRDARGRIVNADEPQPARNVDIYRERDWTRNGDYIPADRAGGPRNQRPKGSSGRIFNGNIDSGKSVADTLMETLPGARAWTGKSDGAPHQFYIGVEQIKDGARSDFAKASVSDGFMVIVSGEDARDENLRRLIEEIESDPTLRIRKIHGYHKETVNTFLLLSEPSTYMSESKAAAIKLGKLFGSGKNSAIATTKKINPKWDNKPSPKRFSVQADGGASAEKVSPSKDANGGGSVKEKLSGWSKKLLPRKKSGFPTKGGSGLALVFATGGMLLGDRVEATVLEEALSENIEDSSFKAKDLPKPFGTSQ